MSSFCGHDLSGVGRDVKPNFYAMCKSRISSTGATITALPPLRLGRICVAAAPIHSEGGSQRKPNSLVHSPDPNKVPHQIEQKCSSAIHKSRESATVSGGVDSTRARVELESSFQH